jgi:Bifunctional DNA primase/polymerase, N-terminal
MAPRRPLRRLLAPKAYGGDVASATDRLSTVDTPNGGFMNTVPHDPARRDPRRSESPARRRLLAALDAAGRGWPVFPVHRHTKTPAVRDWENQATLDPDRINSWWSTSDKNIGLACGPARLVVIDLDTTSGEAAPAQWAQLGVTCGADLFAIVAARAGHPHPVDTYTVQTPHAGSHLYFAAPTGPELRNTAGALGWRVDTRAAGGFVLAAGSVLPIGRRLVPYRVLRDMPPVSLPSWLRETLTPHPPAERPMPHPPRHIKPYVQAALRGETNAVTDARPGVRNTTLFRAAANLGRLVGAGLLDETTATNSLITAAATHIGVDGFTNAEAHRTIANGLTRGQARPTAVQPDGRR